MKHPSEKRWMVTMAVTVITLMIGTADARRGERPRYRTAYACEGGQLHISCDEGHLIHLIRANYGRFSISICNEHGNLDWSVDCTSHRSYYVIYESCGMKKRCSLPASSSVFDDPCPGTLKYLEAHYKCVPDSVSTTTSTTPSTTTTTTTSTTTRPPIIIPQTRYHRPPSSTTSSTTATTTTTTVSPTIPSTPPPPPSIVVVTTSEPSTEFSSWMPTAERSSPASASPLPSVHPPSSTEVYSISSGHSTLEGPEVFCTPVFSRALLWNWTRPGAVVVQKCPGGTTGDARWQCDSGPVRWVPDTPDLSQCSSLWVDSLKNRVSSGDSVVNIAAELAVITSTKALYGGDVRQTTEIVQRLVAKMAEKVKEIPEDKQRHQVLQELLESVLDVSNNLLESSQRASWHDLPPGEQRQVASALLEGLEQGGWLLAATLRSRYHFRKADNNVLISVRLVEAWAVSEVSFPSPEDVDGTSWSKVEDSLVLSTQALLGSATNGVVKVVFVAYNRVEDFLGSASVASVAQTEAGRENVSQVINSRVIAASVGRYHMVKLAEPVVIILRHIREDNVTNPQCVFWDFDARFWSSEGCWVRGYNVSHTICACDHLTNFALLMDVRATEMTTQDKVILRVVTYVGCSVAMLCFLLTGLVLQVFRSLRTDRNTINKNLCVCLLVSEAMIICGTDHTHLRVVCGVLAGALHYFLLAAFVWLLLDCFQLYVMLAEQYQTEKSRQRWYYLLAYGVPAVVVGISAVVDPHSYGTQRYCWLRMDNYYIFTFVGPASACVLAAALFLSLAVGRTYCQSSKPAVKNKEHTRLKTARVFSREAALVLSISSATWTLCLLYLRGETAIMAYLFTACNCLQGLFIFIFYCVQNVEVRKAFQKSLMRGERGPACVRPPKPGQRRASQYLHSNGVASLPPTSSQHSLPHLSWSSLKGLRRPPTTITIPRRSTQDRPSIATLSNWGREGTRVACRPSESARDAPPSDSWSLSGGLTTVGRSSGGVRLDGSGIFLDILRPNNRHQSWSSSQGTDHIYESIDDGLAPQHVNNLNVTPAPMRTSLAPVGLPPAYDSRPPSERRCSGPDICVERTFLHTLRVALASSPQSGNWSGLTDGSASHQVAYSATPSRTDSDKSSSSFVDGRYLPSSSVSAGVSSSPGFQGADGQLQQSLPNLRLWDSSPQSAFSCVPKYPSDNAVLSDNELCSQT